MRKFSIFAAAILALALVGTASAQGPLTVTLDSLNNSGISGTATLTAQGSQTQVVVSVTGEPAGASEPMHIHVGQCGPTLGSVKYPLKNVENGASTTVVNASLDSLQNGNFAINVHESAANIQNYVACGNIPALAASSNASTSGAASTTTSPSLPKTGGVPLGATVVLAGLLLGAGALLRRRLP